MDLQPGVSGRTVLVVAAADTASSLHTGVVPVLATPRLVALCEEAACCAVDPLLPEGTTTVACRVQFDHLAPIRVGSEVQAEAVLERVEGRRITFTVSVTDASGLVGAGRVTRVVVDLDTFMAKAR
ncbi:MAG: thioesterase [Actinomycetota bacterium]|nr:thioesterase [Actinomycetota bacterium]MDA8281658.1 thioesterase [Actinomycetota bacterium]